MKFGRGETVALLNVINYLNKVEGSLLALFDLQHCFVSGLRHLVNADYGLPVRNTSIFAVKCILHPDTKRHIVAISVCLGGKL